MTSLMETMMVILYCLAITRYNSLQPKKENASKNQGYKATGSACYDHPELRWSTGLATQQLRRGCVCVCVDVQSMFHVSIYTPNPQKQPSLKGLNMIMGPHWMGTPVPWHIAI